jgi:hypothetical protein
VLSIYNLKVTELKTHKYIFLRALVISSVLLLTALSSAHAAPMNYIGNWNSTTNYVAGSVVVLNKQTYYAILSSNLNKNPVAAITYWRAIGTVGNTLASGTGVPVLTVGNVGDFYIETTNKRIYGPKTASGWSATFVSMVGIQGATGAQGIRGLTGAQGAQGIQGLMGYQGYPGAPGAKGDMGLTGATGIQGLTGLTGLTGAIGAKGATGLTGLTGAIGSKGDIGLTGAIGPVGAKGAQGIQGIQGLIGLTGTQGIQGLTGIQGAIGATGLTGAIGAKGATGLTGAAGAKGDTGATGPMNPGSFIYSNTCGVSGTNPCKIGTVGPGGGWIFFVDYYDQYPGFTYLEAAPTDTDYVPWCNNTDTSIPATGGWAGNAVGKGKANTTAMLGVCTSGAAKAADQYLTATKSDWFLPSEGELMLMYTNLRQAGVGGFAYDFYWSSTEYNSNYAWHQTSYDGDQNFNSKGMPFGVRAVRAF